MFIYGGYIQTGGMLDNNQPWQGVQIMLAEVRDPQKPPMTASCFKGVPSDSLMQSLYNIHIGTPVEVNFTLTGNDRQGNPVFKVSEITPVKGK